MASTKTTPAPGAPQLDSLGKFRMATMDIDITSYPNPAGEPISATDFNMTTLAVVFAISTENGYLIRTNSALTALFVHGGAGAGAELTEVTNATDVGTFRLLAIGY